MEALAAEARIEIKWKDVDFEPDLSASVADGTLLKVQVGAGIFTRADFNGVRAFELSGSGVTAVYPAYSVVDDVNNLLYICTASGWKNTQLID